MEDYESSALYTTEIGDGSQAAWWVSGEAVRVVGITLPNGAPQILEDQPTLGQCVDLMPRELWNKVRMEFAHTDEYQRLRERTA